MATRTSKAKAKKKAAPKRLSQQEMASMGGKARAAACSARQRMLSARKAAMARWHPEEDWAR
jgi:hypothetical protein